MYVCVLNAQGETLLHRNMPAESQHLDRALSRFDGDLVVAVECIFTWYWIADFCEDRGIAFVLGHALYMKAIRDAGASRRRSRRPASDRVLHPHLRITNRIACYLQRHSPVLGNDEQSGPGSLLSLPGEASYVLYGPVGLRATKKPRSGGCQLFAMVSFANSKTRFA